MIWYDMIWYDMILIWVWHMRNQKINVVPIKSSFYPGFSNCYSYVWLPDGTHVPFHGTIISDARIKFAILAQVEPQVLPLSSIPCWSHVLHRDFMQILYTDVACLLRIRKWVSACACSWGSHQWKCVTPGGAAGQICQISWCRKKTPNWICPSWN